MDQLSIMRRANGELFTLTLKGQKHLAVWPSLQSAMRYKARNRELLVFLPAPVASPFGQKSLAPLRKENLGLFLLIDDGQARFRDGRRISWEELDNDISASTLPAIGNPEVLKNRSDPIDWKATQVVSTVEV